MAPVLKSAVQQRSRRANAVVKRAQKHVGWFEVATQLVDACINLATVSPDERAKTMKMSELPAACNLSRLVPVDLVVPRQAALNVTVPETGQPSASFQPFSSHLVCVTYR